MYCVPPKPPKSSKIPSKKEEECYTKLNQLITKVKMDVSQSIMLNQSKNQMFKNSMHNNSRMFNCKATDVTYESAFPNVTHEELHLSMNKYNGNGNCFPLDDETNPNFNNSLEVPTANVTITQNPPAPLGQP